MRTWLITGCSTGLGRALAQAVLARGWNAVVTARDAAKVEDLAVAYRDTALVCALDVCDPAQIEATIAAARARFGQIDVLVNNAGHGYRAAVEEADDGEVRALFDTNFFGPVDMIKAVLAEMRERKSGYIINVSSIAGRMAAPGSGYYSATKFALEGMSDALRKEVGPLGIRVMVVEPGSFRTDFAGRSLQQAGANIPDYAGTAGRRRKENDHSNGKQPGDPVRGADAIIKAIEAVEPPFRLALGRDAMKYLRAVTRSQGDELEAWAQVSESTDFPA